MHRTEVPLRDQQVHYRKFGQLVDKPLHGPGYFPPAAGPEPQFRGYFRDVQLLLAGLFQPLRPAVPVRVSFRVSGIAYSVHQKEPWGDSGWGISNRSGIVL